MRHVWVIWCFLNTLEVVPLLIHSFPPHFDSICPTDSETFERILSSKATFALSYFDRTYYCQLNLKKLGISWPLLSLSGSVAIRTTLFMYNWIVSLIFQWSSPNHIYDLLTCTYIYLTFERKEIKTQTLAEFLFAYYASICSFTCDNNYIRRKRRKFYAGYLKLTFLRKIHFFPVLLP